MAHITLQHNTNLTDTNYFNTRLSIFNTKVSENNKRSFDNVGMSLSSNYVG